jgi:DNA polymerase III epsilon subunit-like protein
MDGALAVNGFTREQITDKTKMTEGELVVQFLEWSQELDDRTLTGQNVSFDRDMLKAAVERAGLNWTLPYRTLDTHTMCYLHMVHRGIKPPLDAQHKRSNLDLDAIMNYCGIPDEPDPHNALTGALSHAEVASRLLYGQPLLPEFSHFKMPW